MFLLFLLTGSESGGGYRALAALSITTDVSASAVLLCGPSRTATMVSLICAAVVTVDSQDKVRKITAVGVDVEKEEPVHCYWECDWYGILENAMDHYVIRQSHRWVCSQENQSSVLKKQLHYQQSLQH